MNRRVFKPWLGTKRGPVALLAAALAAGASLSLAGCGGAASAASARAAQVPAEATGLGQLTGLLPRDKLTLESAIDVNLSKETVRLPLYPGTPAHAEEGLVRAAGRLRRRSRPRPGRELRTQAGQHRDQRPGRRADGDPRLADGGAEPISAPRRCTSRARRTSAPPGSPWPGRTGSRWPSSSPVPWPAPGTARSSGSPGSDVIYNAPIVATGNGPFDVVHHTNTADRVLGIHIAGKSKPGQFAESWADMLFVKGFDAGQPIVYLSTDAGQPLTAVLERSTYVPALNNAAFNGGDDFLGSARERLFGFINGQTGVNNRQAQGFQHLAKDGMVSEDASQANTAFIDALRYGGDLLNVFGDFPTLKDPRHADAYSPLWDAQLGLWTPKAVREGLNKRQIDENIVFNLAATRPDLLTGVNPATGQPQPYGSVGVDINCAVIGYTATRAHRQPCTPGPQLPVPTQVTGTSPQASGRNSTPHLNHPRARHGGPAGHA